jgi:RNA polymerase subunit RPABC4/transcription elongation factor Spt4
MSSIFGETESAVFQCPSCKQYISGDSTTCRLCSSPITVEMKQIAIAKEKKSVTDAAVSYYGKFAGIGALMFFGGGAAVALNAFSASLGERFFTRSLIVSVLGLGQLIYGLHGIYKEKRGK